MISPEGFRNAKIGTAIGGLALGVAAGYLTFHNVLPPLSFDHKEAVGLGEASSIFLGGALMSYGAATKSKSEFKDFALLGMLLGTALVANGITFYQQSVQFSLK